MSVIKSKELSVKPFLMIKILPDDANYEEILKFCGWNEKDIKQEFIYHSEGSPTLIGESELYDREGDFVIKWKDGSTEIISARDIKLFIEI